MSDMRIVQKSGRGKDPEKTARHKGRAYQCLKCLHQPVPKEVIDVKGRIEDHILKMHVSLGSVPFYCRLCKFICQDRATLDSHVTRYRRHQIMERETGEKNREAFLVENPSPYKIGLRDYVVLSKEESFQFFLEKITGSSGSDILAGAIAAIDDDILGSPSSALHDILFEKPSTDNRVEETVQLPATPALVVIQSVSEISTGLDCEDSAPVDTGSPQEDSMAEVEKNQPSDVVATQSCPLDLRSPQPSKETGEKRSLSLQVENESIPLDLTVKRTDRVIESPDVQPENILGQLLDVEGTTTEDIRGEKRTAEDQTSHSPKRARSLSPAFSMASRVSSRRSSSSGSSCDCEANSKALVAVASGMKESMEAMTRKMQETVEGNARAMRCLEKAMVEMTGAMKALTEAMTAERRKEDGPKKQMDDTDRRAEGRRDDCWRERRDEARREEEPRRKRSRDDEKENNRGRLHSVLGNLYNRPREESHYSRPVEKRTNRSDRKK